MEKTGATPGGDTLQRIAEYFGVSIDYLLGKEAKSTPATGGEREDVLDDWILRFTENIRN